jgi:hypothetical protein
MQQQRYTLVHVLPWIGLLIVLFASASAMHAAAAAIGPNMATSSATTADAADRSGGSDTLVGLVSTRQAASFSSSPQMVVTIIGRDEMTGDRMQVQCMTDGARVASDALLVDLADLRNVASAVCG